MSWPTDPLDLVVELAPGADPAADPITYDWVDITRYWRTGTSQIQISRGRQSPLSDTVPSSCSLTLDNTDGRFTPRNPIGPYYGQLGKNTPLRVRLRQAHDTFARTTSNGWGTADSGHVWLADGTASQFSTNQIGVHAVASLNTTVRSRLQGLSVTDVDMTFVALVATAPSGAYVRTEAVVRYVDANNYAALQVHRHPSGAIDLQLIDVVGGSASLLAALTSTVTHTAGISTWIRVLATGGVLRAKIWRDDASQPDTWEITGEGATVAAGSVGIATLLPPGNTNVLPFTVIYDNLYIGSTRFTGYVDRWPPRWDSTGRNRWATVTAHGTLRRIATAGEATRSALYRYLTEGPGAFWLVGYWPLEDGDQATEASSYRRDVEPLAASGKVRFGTASPPGGVGTMVDTTGVFLHGRIPARYATDWRVECVIAHSAVPTTTVRVLSWLTPGTIQRWDLNTTSTGIRLVGLTAVSGGSTVINISTGFVPQPGTLHHLRADITLSGATVTADVYADGTLVGTGSSGSSSALQPTVIRINPDASTTDMPAVGHLAVTAASPLPATTSAAAALGNTGEQAHERIAAVCAERGVPYAAQPGTLTSEVMGPRPAGSLVAVLRDGEATDGGVLYELTSGHLSYKPRRLFYNQDARVTLDYDAGHVGEPFEPADDDAQVRNDVTARRPSGVEARVTDDTHISAVGRYEGSLSINPIDDDHLTQSAAWAVHRGTVAGDRFDTIAVSMTRAAALADRWLHTDIGDRITVDNVPAELTPDPVDVILVGYTEVFEYPRRWTVGLVCEPASAWMIGVLDDTVLGRLDTAGSTTATAGVASRSTDNTFGTDYVLIATSEDSAFSIGNKVVLHGPDGRRKEPTVFTIYNKTSGFGLTNLFLTPAPQEQPQGNLSGTLDWVYRVDETSLQVATTSGPVWTQDPAHMPFDINVNGERVTVTAVSGASSPQTFTVVRSVNGVEKGHPAGTPVKLWQPLVLGL